MTAVELAMVSSPTRARVRSDGRWRGRVTHHALPESADELADLDPALRARLAHIWLCQAATEERVAHSFGVVHESLLRLGGDAGLVALAARAVDDEHRHAALCEELSGRYLGRASAAHVALAPRRPAHAAASSPELRRALWVVGQCALNETFASAYLSTAYRGARSPLGRAAIRELLEDEVDHARLGWAYLSAAPAALRRELGEWLVPLVVCNLREWQTSDFPEDDSLSAHGVPPRRAVLDALSAAIRFVLVPGFAHVGLDTRALERWSARAL